MKTKPRFPCMNYILPTFSAFVGAHFAWYFIGDVEGKEERKWN